MEIFRTLLKIDPPRRILGIMTRGLGKQRLPHVAGPHARRTITETFCGRSGKHNL
jgi:hypothetical protein